MSIERNTHLLDWLNDGWTHCQHGTREWCEGYLHNAHDVIKAQDDELSRLREENTKLRADLAFADKHAARIEALLEPHIKWDDAVKKGINESADRLARALSEREGQE